VVPPLAPPLLLPAPLGEVVLLPEPAPLPLLGDVELLPDVPPALELPVAPLDEPLVMPSSFRHFSRSAPTMPRHLLLVPPAALPVLPLAPVLLLPDAPEDEPPEALSDELLPEALGVELLLPEALGVELLLPEALGVELLLLPDALGVELLLPDALGVELVPELCASVTLDSAKSAAAVAALMSFRVISVFPPGYLLLPEPLLPAPLLPVPLEPAPLLLPEPMPLPLGLGVLLPLPDEAPLLGELLVPPLDDAPPLDDPPLEAPDLVK
jgi:hypothetical protein